ncbi:MAG: CDP-alcohol phosphatidyltransferase family protein, partial [Bauldia sp.]
MQDQPIPGFIVTLPNIITLLRLVLVPTIVWLITIQRPVLAFWLFVMAGAGDALDGHLARKFDLRSRLGALLDPLADKVLLVSLYVVLTIMSEIPTWLAYLVVSRDVLIVG